MNPADQVRHFLARVEQMRATRLFKDQSDYGYTIRFFSERGVEVENREPDADDFNSFILVFRPLIMDKDPVHYTRIANILAQALTDDTIRDGLMKARDIWKSELKALGNQIIWNGKPVTAEWVISNVIQGYMSHTDMEKIDAINSLPPEHYTVLRLSLMEYIDTVTTQIQYLAHIADVATSQGALDYSRVKGN
jgi:hypothetical protein